jgi:hypothetical protein
MIKQRKWLYGRERSDAYRKHVCELLQGVENLEKIENNKKWSFQTIL